MREEDFTSLGGVRIHFRGWQPEGAPRGVVVICHGVNSHGGQYLWTGEHLASKGFAVWALDLAVVPELADTKPAKEWGADELAIDAFHHVVFVGVTALALRALLKKRGR